jgi:hypothetical protein
MKIEMAESRESDGTEIEITSVGFNVGENL